MKNKGSGTKNAFEKSLLSFTKAFHGVEEFTENIVRGAVEETIDSVSEMYGLDGHKIKSCLVENIVSMYGRSTCPEETCKAITYRGKRCVRAVFVDGMCQVHSKQQLKKPKRSDQPRDRGDEAVVSKVMKILKTVS